MWLNWKFSKPRDKKFIHTAINQIFNLKGNYGETESVTLTKLLTNTYKHGH